VEEIIRASRFCWSFSLPCCWLTFWFVRSYLYADPLEPVTLSKKEQRKLDDKLVTLGLNPVHVLPDARRSPDRFDADGRLIAERYSEQGSRRRVRLTEKELNALLASSPELASRAHTRRSRLPGAGRQDHQGNGGPRA